MSKRDKIGRENFRTWETKNASVRVQGVRKVSWTENHIFGLSFFGSTKCTTHIFTGVSGRCK